LKFRILKYPSKYSQGMGRIDTRAPPEGVWQLLSMDFRGPITPTSGGGNRYIIALADLLSKFVITRAVRDCTASIAARFLQEDVICKYGTPKSLLIDNGTHFTSSMMENLLKRLGIVHLYSTPYHPQTNGQIERLNSTMDAKIVSLSNQSRSEWDDQLPFVTFNYNTTIHSTTKLIPFELMYGRSPVLPCDAQHTTKLQNYVSSLSDTARHSILLAQHASKSRYDKNRSDPSYRIGDIILLRNMTRRYKLDVHYEGPYRILRRLDHKTYIVQHIHLHNVIRQVTVDFMSPIFNQPLV
jgi:transposase InsO family protein